MTTLPGQVGIGMVEAIVSALAEVGGSSTLMGQVVKAIKAADPAAYNTAKLAARATVLRKDHPVEPIREDMILPVAKALMQLTDRNCTVNWAWVWLIAEKDPRGVDAHLAECATAANEILPVPAPSTRARTSARVRV